MAFAADQYVKNGPPATIEGAPAPPDEIKHGDFVEAVTPLLALAGTDPMSILIDGFSVTREGISFQSIVPVAGVEPVSSSDDDDASAVWVWPVHVPIESF